LNKAGFKLKKEKYNFLESFNVSKNLKDLDLEKVFKE
jgi:hypothetical protein